MTPTDSDALAADDAEFARHLEGLSGRTSLAAIDALLNATAEATSPRAAADEARRIADQMAVAVSDLSQAAIMRR